MASDESLVGIVTVKVTSSVKLLTLELVITLLLLTPCIKTLRLVYQEAGEQPIVAVN